MEIRFPKKKITSSWYMIKALGLLIILLGIMNFPSCSSSVQQGLVIWSEDDQLLLDIGSNNNIGVGDKISVYREIQLTHPTSGEDLGMLKEDLADASIIAARKNSATAQFSRESVSTARLKIPPGDKIIVTSQKTRQTIDFITQIGSVTFAEAQSQDIEITLRKSVEIHPSDTLTIAMPFEIIKHLVSGDKIALQMKKIADIEVITTDFNSNKASCRIIESSSYPEIGDAVVQLSDSSISSWFQETDEFSEDIIFQRAYRQALRHYQSSEYWQVIRNLQRIEALSSEFANTLYLLASSYKHLGMYNQAHDYLQRAARQNPEDAKILVELAYMYLDENRLREAADVYQRLTNLFPDNYQLWIDLSDIYEQMGDKAKSDIAYQKAVQFDSDNE